MENIEDKNNSARPEVWQFMAQNLNFLNEGTPQAKALGLKIIEVQKARAKGILPWRDDLIGNSKIGTIASGAVITLVDQVCGASCMAALNKPSGMATLDLRIDYMRPSRRGHDIRAEGHCYRVSEYVAFVRALAFDGPHEDDLIASAQASFMIIKDRKMATRNKADKKDGE